MEIKFQKLRISAKMEDIFLPTLKNKGSAALVFVIALSAVMLIVTKSMLTITSFENQTVTNNRDRLIKSEANQYAISVARVFLQGAMIQSLTSVNKGLYWRKPASITPVGTVLWQMQDGYFLNNGVPVASITIPVCDVHSLTPNDFLSAYNATPTVPACAKPLSITLRFDSLTTNKNVQFSTQVCNSRSDSGTFYGWSKNEVIGTCKSQTPINIQAQCDQASCN